MFCVKSVARPYEIASSSARTQLLTPSKAIANSGSLDLWRSTQAATGEWIAHYFTDSGVPLVSATGTARGVRHPDASDRQGGGRQSRCGLGRLGFHHHGAVLENQWRPAWIWQAVKVVQSPQRPYRFRYTVSVQAKSEISAYGRYVKFATM
jgi:hypothetical protein